MLKQEKINVDALTHDHISPDDTLTASPRNSVRYPGQNRSMPILDTLMSLDFSKGQKSAQYKFPCKLNVVFMTYPNYHISLMYFKLSNFML